MTKEEFWDTLAKLFAEFEKENGGTSDILLGANVSMGFDVRCWNGDKFHPGLDFSDILHSN